MAMLEAEAAPEPVTELEAEVAPEPVAELEAEAAAPKPVTELEAEAAPKPVTELEAEPAPKPVTELEAEAVPKHVTELEAEAAPNPLTELCNRITEHHLQNEVERMDKGDLSEPGRILFLLIAMAASNFWKQTLKFDNLDSSFAATNSDVVIVEALYWIWCLFGKMMFTEFNPALVGAETGERGVKIPKTEMDNLFWLRKALELMNAQIEAKTGWDVEQVGASRLKEYGDIQDTDKLIGAFTRRVISALGKQSIHDEDTDDFGRFALEETKLGIAITIWFTAMRPGYYQTFKNSCALYCGP